MERLSCRYIAKCIKKYRKYYGNNFSVAIIEDNIAKEMPHYTVNRITWFRIK